MSYETKIVRGSAMLFLMTAVASLFGYAIRMILTRTIPKVSYGYIYSAMSFIGLLGIFFDFGLVYAVIRFTAFYMGRKNYSKVKEILLMSLMTKIILATVVLLPVIVFSKEISAWFFHTSNYEILTIIAITNFFSIFYYVFRGFTQGTQHFFAYSLGEPIMMGIVLLAVIAFPKSALHVAYAYLISSVLISAFYIAFNIAKERKIFKAPIKKFDIGTMKEILRFSVPVFFSSIGYTIITRTDVAMLTYFKGLEQVAYYQVAIPTSQVLWKIVASIAPIVSPVVTSMFSLNSKDSIRKSFSFVVKISMIFVIPATFAMFLYPKIIIRILFGNSYVQAASALQILSIVAIFYTYVTIMTTFIGAKGDTKKISTAVMISAITNVIFNWILIPKFGINGAAAATLMSFVVQFLVLSKYARDMGLPMSFDILLKFLISGAVFSSSVYILKGILSMNVYEEMVIVILISLIVYTASLFALGLVDVNEIRSFIRSLNLRH